MYRDSPFAYYVAQCPADLSVGRPFELFFRSPAGLKCRLHCLTKAPHLPSWTIWRLRQLLRTLECRPSTSKARRGLSSSIQALQS